MTGNLTHGPADIIRYLLITLSQGTLPTDSGSWPIYTAREPDTPDNVVTVRDTLGSSGGRFMTDGVRQEHYGFQIRIRGGNYNESIDKAFDIANSLDTAGYPLFVTVGSGTGTGDDYTVSNVSRTSQPIHIGKETPTSKRDVVTLNGLIRVKQDLGT